MDRWPDWGKRYGPGLFIILPPENVRGIVNAQRDTYDPLSHSYIGAHITVTQPLLNIPNKNEWDLLARLLAKFPPIEIRYGPVKSFLPYPCIWYDVQPADQVLDLREALHQTGLFNLEEGYIEDFIPHMTITEGQSGPEVNNALLERLQKESRPGNFLCDELVLSVPNLDFQFSPWKHVPLG